MIELLVLLGAPILLWAGIHHLPGLLTKARWLRLVLWLIDVLDLESRVYDSLLSRLITRSEAGKRWVRDLWVDMPRESFFEKFLSSPMNKSIQGKGDQIRINRLKTLTGPTPTGVRSGLAVVRSAVRRPGVPKRQKSPRRPRKRLTRSSRG